MHVGDDPHMWGIHLIAVKRMPPEPQLSWLSGKIPDMFGSGRSINCSILTLANAEHINTALSPAALKHAQLLLCEAA
jgi:hypothetical protein